MSYEASPISSRNQFGWLLYKLKLTGAAVEVGTHRGDFARVLLNTWPGRLMCVDPWCVPPGYEYQAEMLLYLGGDGDRKLDYLAAVEATKEHANRVLLTMATSEQASHAVPPNSLDFVYIDGDHERAAVTQDIALWWPKLRAGAMLAGHDWLCPGDMKYNWGKNIQPPVHELMVREGIDIHLVVEEGGLPWSWYCIKPKRSR